MVAGLAEDDLVGETADLWAPRRRSEDKNSAYGHPLVALLRAIPSLVVEETVALPNDK